MIRELLARLTPGSSDDDVDAEPPGDLVTETDLHPGLLETAERIDGTTGYACHECSAKLSVQGDPKDAGIKRMVLSSADGHAANTDHRVVVDMTGDVPVDVLEGGRWD